MKTTNCFHAASLADLWDRLEENEKLWMAGPGGTFVSQATPDAASQNERRNTPRHSPRDPDRMTVSIKKSAMILMRKTVLVALEMEPAKRDEFLARMHVQYLNDAKRANASGSEAQEWAESLDQSVRKTIDAVGRLESVDGRSA